MGELSDIRSTITDHIPGAQRVMLTLRLERDVNVWVSFFDAIALTFHDKLVAYGKEPRVVLATGINPKLVGGKLCLNGSSATHIYFDSKTAAGNRGAFQIARCGSKPVSVFIKDPPLPKN